MTKAKIKHSLLEISISTKAGGQTYLMVGAEIKLINRRRDMFNGWGLGMRKMCFRKNVFSSMSWKKQDKQYYTKSWFWLETNKHDTIQWSTSHLPNNTKYINSQKSFISRIWVRPIHSCPAKQKNKRYLKLPIVYLVCWSMVQTCAIFISQW